MQTRDFDAIVIGTGQSGPSLAVRLAGAGRKVAVIERARFGGTCVNNGCIPTKTLVASARAAYVARRGADFGVNVGGPITVDMKAVKARKDAIVRESNEGVEKWLTGTAGCTVIRGQARFVGPRTVRVGDEELKAEQVFVNVGARATVPPIPGLDAVPFLTNSGMMDVDFLPEHLVIVGGSYIGLEFAQMYRRFGSRVTVIERGPRLLSRDDEDVGDAIRAIVENEGVAVRTLAAIRRVEQRGGPVVHLEDGSEVAGSHLLLAIGRVPNTGDLGLAEAGVEVDKRGFIVVDDELKTSVPGVFALGDCNGRGAFTHTSYNDFEIVAANLLDGDHRRVSDRILTYGLFIDPPLGRCGWTEREVRASGRPALVARMPMTRVGRAHERSETQGFLKILVDAGNRQILGAAFLGIECDEVIQLILTAMYAKAPCSVIQRAMYIHPTVSELLPTLLGSLAPLT
jgi:pyruvate/2-oxoglutarate dehydrogenase complex dihydrolipoamide dehydrogenase (E3) component